MVPRSFENFDWDEGNREKCRKHGVSINGAKNMSKRAPRLRTDDEAEKLLEKDLSDYIDPKYMVPLRFEFESKDRWICSQDET